MNDVISVDGQAAGPGLSQMERVVDTFVAPKKTFTDILRSTSWWLPFLLMVLVTLGVDRCGGETGGLGPGVGEPGPPESEDGREAGDPDARAKSRPDAPLREYHPLM